MGDTNAIKKAWTVAQVAGTIAGSTLGQPQSPETQMGNYQKSSIPSNSKQVNTGRANPSSSGKK